MNSGFDGGPAFPCEHTNERLQQELIAARNDGASLSFFDIKKLSSLYPGMSLRDWFAGQAVPGIICFPGTLSGSTNKTPKAVAQLAYQVADAMLAAREVRS